MRLLAVLVFPRETVFARLNSLSEERNERNERKKGRKEERKKERKYSLVCVCLYQLFNESNNARPPCCLMLSPHTNIVFPNVMSVTHFMCPPNISILKSILEKLFHYTGIIVMVQRLVRKPVYLAQNIHKL